MPNPTDNDLLPMTQDDWNDLTSLNGGRAIPDRDTQNQLIALRDKANSPEGNYVVNPNGYNAGLFSVPAIGQESNIRSASIPLDTSNGVAQPSDINMLKNQQSAITGNEDLTAKLRALNVLKGR